MKPPNGASTPAVTDATLLLRTGAAAGVGSAVVAVIFNAVHPRATSSSLNDVVELLRIVSRSGSWRLVHVASVVATLGGVAAIVAVLWSILLAGSPRWAVIAFVSLVITTPILLLSVGIDGFAIKAIADRWARAAPADRPALEAAATALRGVDVGVLNLVMLGQFGLTAILIGVASASSALYGKAVGAVAVAGGILGVVCGGMQGLSGRLTTLSYLVLLTASLALFTLWLVLASLVLWRAAPDVARKEAGIP